MAHLTCTVEHWSDETDVIRLFQAELADSGEFDRHDPDSWQIMSDIVETDESGESSVLKRSDPIYDEVVEMLVFEAEEQYLDQ